MCSTALLEIHSWLRICVAFACCVAVSGNSPNEHPSVVSKNSNGGIKPTEVYDHLQQQLDDDTQSKLKALRAFAQQIGVRAPAATQTRNITITKERIGAAAVSRWDDGGGAALDSAIKDDGPKQLQYAMMALASVAGTIICGGAVTVACCWQNRERGHLKSAKYQKVDDFMFRLRCLCGRLHSVGMWNPFRKSTCLNRQALNRTPHTSSLPRFKFWSVQRTPIPIKDKGQNGSRPRCSSVKLSKDSAHACGSR